MLPQLFCRGLAILIGIRGASALVVQQAEPTGAIYGEPDGSGWTPKPTQAPIHPLQRRYGSMLQRDLYERQNGGAPICAYVSGYSNVPYYCFSGGGCRFFTSPNYFACCPTDTNGNYITTNNECASATLCLGYGQSNVGLAATDLYALTTANTVFWYGRDLRVT